MQSKFECKVISSVIPVGGVKSATCQSSAPQKSAAMRAGLQSLFLVLFHQWEQRH